MEKPTVDEVKETLALGDSYIKLRDTLLGELKRTGLEVSPDAPFSEPQLTVGTSTMPENELKKTYDSFLVFYDFLTDQITDCEVHLETTKERAETIAAKLLLDTNKLKNELGSAELRKAWVQIHPAYQRAQQDYLYYKQLHGAQSERRRKISKSIERLYRELWLRSNDRPGLPRQGAPPPAPAQRPTVFRKVGKPSE